MSDRIEKAFKELVDAVTIEATEQVERIRALAEPFINQVVAQATEVMTAAKSQVEEILKEAEKETEKEVSAPTPEQYVAIVALRGLGKSDAEIAETVGVSILTVKKAV
jgi:DNA-binding NarL/FixJ family response regulator